MIDKIEKGQWKGWEITKEGTFRKHYKNDKYIDALMGLFFAYDKKCLGYFMTLKEAEEALKK